jgi:hypothetical protein
MIDRSIYTTPAEIAYAEACEQAGIRARELGLTGRDAIRYVGSAVEALGAKMTAESDIDVPDITGCVTGLWGSLHLVG